MILQHLRLSSAGVPRPFLLCWYRKGCDDDDVDDDNDDDGGSVTKTVTAVSILRSIRLS